MSKTILFVGSPVSFTALGGVENQLRKFGYQLLETTSVIEATSFLSEKSNRKIDMVIVAGSGSEFSNWLDSIPVKLPHVIYWYSSRNDQIPQRSNVMCLPDLDSASDLSGLASALLGVNET